MPTCFRHYVSAAAANRLGMFSNGYIQKRMRGTVETRAVTPKERLMLKAMGACSQLTIANGV